MLLQKRAQKLEKEFPSYFPQDEKNRLLDIVRTNHLEILFNTKFNHSEDWDFEVLSFNKSLSLDMVLNNLDKNWDVDYLSSNESITLDMILQTKDIIKWNWYQVSINSNITLKEVQEHPELPWCKERLAYNKNIPDEYFGKDIDSLPNWRYNKNITISEVLKYKNKISDWETVSRSKNITMKDIEKHPNIPWDWQEISRNPNLTIDIILKHRDKLCWHLVSMNKAVTMRMIEKYHWLPWDWETIAYNKNLTLVFVIDNIEEKDWEYDVISSNPNMTLNIINYSRWDWDWEDRMAMNKNITSDFVLEKADVVWNLESMSFNSFHHYSLEKKTIRKRIRKVLRINGFLHKMKNSNTYFKFLVKDVIDLISIYY